MKSIKQALVDLFGFSLIRILDNYRIPKDGCLHVGANVGSELDSYEEYGFKNVVWIEGYRPFYEELLKKIDGRQNHHPFNMMVSEVHGEVVTFKVASNTGSSTIFEPTNSWYETFNNLSFEKTETVTCSRIDKVLKDKFNTVFLNKLKFLVLDIEGAELKALKAMGELLNNVEYALVEVSLRRNFQNAPLIRDIDEFLYSQSFKRIFLKHGAASGDALYKKVPSISSFDRFKMKTQDAVIQFFARVRLTDFVVSLKSGAKKLLFK